MLVHVVFFFETSSKSARGHRMILRLDFLLSVVEEEEEEEVVPIKNKLHLPDKENHNNGR